MVLVGVLSCLLKDCLLLRRPRIHRPPWRLTKDLVSQAWDIAHPAARQNLLERASWMDDVSGGQEVHPQSPGSLLLPTHLH